MVSLKSHFQRTRKTSLGAGKKRDMIFDRFESGLDINHRRLIQRVITVTSIQLFHSLSPDKQHTVFVLISDNE